MNPEVPAEAPADAGNDIDVVIVNYNAGEHLGRCVESVLASAGGAAVGVCIVDNASHDNSAEDLMQRFPGVHVIQNRVNRGFGSACNEGLAAGKAPYVFLLNPDAEVSGGTLFGLLKVAGDRPLAAVIGTLVRDPDGTLYPSARKIPTLWEAAGHALLGPFSRGNRFSRAYTMDSWDRTSPRSVDWVSGSSMLLRREALEQVGGFDEAFFMYAEDADLCTRMREAGWDVVFTPELEVVHDHGLTTRGSRKMIWEHSRSIYRYFSKHQASGWRRVLLPAARLILWVRAAVVSRGLGAGKGRP